METFSLKKAILLCCGIGLLTAGLSVALQGQGWSERSVSAASSTVTLPSRPARLIIPAINVDAPIESVGLFWSGNGEMGIPSNFTDVAWYNGGPRPGMPGSAVIDGHLDGRYVKEAVFYNLDKLKPGDLVEVVDQKGITWQFKVSRLTDYDYNATTTDIFSGDASAARLNLITCAGDWIKGQGLYSQRIVVFTELVGEQNGSK